MCRVKAGRVDPVLFWPRAVRDNSAEVVVPVDLPDVQRLFDEVRTR